MSHTSLASLFSDIADAIRAKTGGSAQIVADNFPTAIAGISTGITPAARKAVNFIDYDGTILYSYTAAEFASLSALPANPSHTGLTARGWNWTLADAKTYVAANGNLWIGQEYRNDNGDTEIDIVLEKGRTSPYLGIAVNGSVTVDWGDSSTATTITGSSVSTQITTQHSYSAAGPYTISIHVNSGTLSLYGTSNAPLLSRNSSTAYANRVYSGAVKAVRIGNNTRLHNLAFANCVSLRSVTIPQSCTSLGNNVFQNCAALQTVSIPKTVATISYSAFSGCNTLCDISFPNISDMSNNLFQYVYTLANITIPSNVTSIGTYAFRDCYGLSEIHFKPTTPPTAGGSNAWTNLPTDCVIYVPTSENHTVLNAYKTKADYPSSTTYNYVEE